jgi:tetratricopeptide (TPR) repeat protein
MAGAPDPVVHVYDTATGRLRLPPLRMPTFIFSLAFTPDSRTLVVGCLAQTVLLDAQGGQPRFLQQASAAKELAVSPDGKALAIGYKGGWPGDGEGVRLWDLTTAKPIGPFHPIHNYRQVTFMDQGRTVLVATVGATRDDTRPGFVNAPGPLHVFDRETGRPSAAALPPGDILSNFWGNNLAARSRDAVFAFRSSTGTIEQWDAAAGHAVGEPMVHPCAVWRMQYSPDGRLLATVCTDNSVRLWDSATGLPLGPPLLHVAPVLSLCFAPVAPSPPNPLSHGGERGSQTEDQAVEAAPASLPPLPFVGEGGRGGEGGSEAYHLVTASAAGEIHDWHLPAAFPDDPERLTLWIEAAAGCKQGRTDTALLDAATWRERCRQLEERWPEAAAALARQRGADLSAELAAWHEVRAGEAEATGNAFGLLWHLDRLAQQRPDDWRIQARRGTVLADSEDFAAALAAFALAAQKGAGEALADWYSHGAGMASGARRWQLARWYLDRQIAARPNEWRAYAERAEVHGQLGQSAERDADLERAVARGAEQSVVLRLAESRVRQRQWPKAAGLYLRAAGQGPLPLAAVHQLALVCLENDDLAGYRNICKGMVKMVNATPKEALTPDVTNAVAWLCALGPKAVEDFDPVVALAEGAVKAGGDARERHDRLNTLGAVLCRAGRYQEARQRLDEGSGAAGKDAAAADWLFLALVHLGLDDPAEAKKCLAKVPQPAPREGAVRWADVETEVLRREVETRLK